MESDVALLDVVGAWVLVSSVQLGAGGELPELHDVAGEGARLVREHILHLAQLLVEVGGLRPYRHVLLFVVHEVVGGHEHALPELDELEGDHEGDGDEVGEDEDPGAALVDEHGGEGLLVVTEEVTQVVHALAVGDQPVGAQVGSDEGHDYLHAEDADDGGGGLPLEFGELVASIGAVLHDLGVVALVDHGAVDVLGVSEDAAAEQEVFGAERGLLLELGQLNHAFELVNGVVGLLAGDYALDGAEPLVGLE
mmetsp:Transcript_6081/g.10323  ORF Transcript_6081/g.10323 Transcript_6081/m.10323 type:complete len:252 (-) Transcript_6081:555-1310(-)